jgi:hypothetical protein
MSKNPKTAPMIDTGADFVWNPTAKVLSLTGLALK